MAFFSAIAAILLLSLQPSAPSGDLINTISKGDAAPSPMEGLFLCTSEIRGKGYFGLCSDPALRVPRASLTSDSDQFSEAQTILAGRLSQLEDDEHWNFRAALDLCLSIKKADSLEIFEKYLISAEKDRASIEITILELLNTEKDSESFSKEDVINYHLDVRNWYLEELFDSRFSEENNAILHSESMPLEVRAYFARGMGHLTQFDRKRILDAVSKEKDAMSEVNNRFHKNIKDWAWLQIEIFNGKPLILETLL
ncbi:hypothetical protein ACFCW2_03610 [Qipengyuania sp. DSG2-2]|uniref:hypothetical protein n=1 Tax=Qipengyuania sp. DGS2-2 TaxID=3349631 RepID=UPI0036D2D8FB